MGPELRRKVVFLGEKTMIFQRELLNFRGVDDGSLVFEVTLFPEKQISTFLLNGFNCVPQSNSAFFREFQTKKKEDPIIPPYNVFPKFLRSPLRCCEHLFSPAPLHGVYPMQARPRARG